MYFLGQPLLYNYLPLPPPNIATSNATWFPSNEIMNYPPHHHHHNHPNSSSSNTSSSQSDSDNSIDTSPTSSRTTTTIIMTGADGATTAPSSLLTQTPPHHHHPHHQQQQKLFCHWSKCASAAPFQNLSDLARHVANAHAHSSAHADGLYRCEWAGCARAMRSFNARYKMLVHVRTHTHEKPHRCAQCAKAFSRAENLKIHWRTHSGEKPYRCQVAGCGKAYSNFSDRFKHARTHICQKPYKCQIAGCEKSYTDPSSLRKHLKTYKHHHVIATPPTEINRVSVIKQIMTTTTDRQRQIFGYATAKTLMYFDEQNPLDLSIHRCTDDAAMNL